MNICNKLIDFNLGDINSVLAKEKLLCNMLALPISDKSNLSIKIDHSYSNFNSIREATLGYLYYLRYFYNDPTDISLDCFISAVKSTLDSSNRNIYLYDVLPSISLGELASNSNTEPFSITGYTVYDLDEFRKLISVFGHDFIHSRLINIVSNSESLDTSHDTVLGYVYNAVYDYPLSKELDNYTPNLNLLKSYDEEVFFETCLAGSFCINYLTCSSKELTNFIKSNTGNLDAINQLLHNAYLLLPYYAGDIISLSKPIIIDKTSPFYSGTEEFNLLFAAITCEMESSEIIEYDLSTLKEFGILNQTTFNLINKKP